MKKYTKVPNIISGKDLDYLTDMFNWNYLTYKRLKDNNSHIKDENLKKLNMKIANTAYENLTKIMKIMKEGVTSGN